MTITGHNLVPSHFNFTTISDTNKPEIISVDCSHQVATSLTTLCFNVDTCDNASGIKDVIELIINRQSGDHIIYTSSNLLEENRTEFNINLNKFEPGDYLMIIASRDYANNTIIYSISFQFSIPIPLTYYILIAGSIMIVGLAGISIYLVYSGIQKYSLIYKRMEDI